MGWFSRGLIAKSKGEVRLLGGWCGDECDGGR